MFELQQRRTFSFSAENPTGTKAGGSRGRDCQKLHPFVTLQPGETVTLCDTDGPGMICHMWFTGYFGHSFILRIYWENEEFPSVEAPLSAFFGNAYDENDMDRESRYVTLNSAKLLSAPSHGYNSYWEMPFGKHCRITLENRHKDPQICFYCITGWYGNISAEAAYFHVQYRQAHPVQKGVAYTVLDGVRGRGFFAGITFAAGINGNSTCWVEGEVKMYIDGDEYPSLNYTGTEDYFCGAYGFGNDAVLRKYQTYNGLYTGMYAVLGNTDEVYNNQQRFLAYRFHEKDPVYFEKDFRMTMDNLGWTGPRYDDYTSVAYYYMETPTPIGAELPGNSEMRMK